MPSLPAAIIPLLLAFAPMFSRPVYSTGKRAHPRDRYAWAAIRTVVVRTHAVSAALAVHRPTVGLPRPAPDSVQRGPAATV